MDHDEFKTYGVNRVATITACAFLASFSGCGILRPTPISVVRNNIPTSLIADGEQQIEVGKPRPVIDAIGWIVGIPSKIIFWNLKADNHSISLDTQQTMAEYLEANGLSDIKVRVNQYRPLDDWRRLTKNTSVAWPWRYTFGAFATLGETILPGRIMGGDHYNPYTATIHLYSDLPSVALHESAHAKDFSNRKYPGTYAAIYALPLVPLWHERTATNDVLAYVEFKNDLQLERESYEILYPGYGTYAGNAAGYAIPAYSFPVYVGGILAGHAMGRWKANEISSADSSKP